MGDYPDGPSVVLGAIVGAFIASMGFLISLEVHEPEWKPTNTREGPCLVQERVHEPEYRLVCK